MRKHLKWVVTLCVALVLMLGLLAGCGEKEETSAQTFDLYWNIDCKTYLGTPGEVAVRRVEADGYYSVRFAHNGKQERIRVDGQLLKDGLDMHKIVTLEFNEEGVAVGFKGVKDATGGLFVEEFFVESVEGNTITCNSSSYYEGYQKTFELTENINVYLIDGDGPLVGMRTKIQKDDKITAVMDYDGNVTDCFVTPLGDIPTVYFSKVRMYNTTSKSTTRESDLTGTYVFEMAVNGEPVTVKTKSAEIASKMDSFAARNMILTFDEDGYVDSAVSGDSVCGTWSSWCNFTGIADGKISTIRVRAGSNQGMYYTEPLASNYIVYDVSPYAEPYGQVTELREGDLVHCLKNSRGQIMIVFVVGRMQEGEVYWNVKRQYDSTAKDTKREPDADGWYEILMTKDGQQYTLKTKDREIIRKIDAQADSHCGLLVEGDVIKAFYATADVTGGGPFASWCDVTYIAEDGKKVQALRTIESSNKGTYYAAPIADNCKIYDVSGMGSYIGELTELRINDRIHGEYDKDGKLCIIYVVRRLADSKMYWNVEAKYNDTTKQTTRARGSDGYYRVTLAVDGKHVTYKVADKEVMNAIDKRPYLRSFGVTLEGNVITKVHEPALVTGGSGWASWADITSIKDGVITAVKITDSDTQKVGTVYTAKMAEDCEVYDVSDLAKVDSYLGVKTKPRVGDRIYGHLNLQGEIQVLYIVGNRKVNGYVAWNFARKYDSTNKVSTREPDADGWYKVDLAVNGKKVTWKTQDKEIIDKIDSMYASGLTVNKEGVIQKHYSYHLITGGYTFGSWCDVTKISGSTVTVKRTLAGTNQGEVYTAKMTSTCKVYDVSENYVDHIGEVTKLQVGDRIHALKPSNNRDLCIIYVVWRPDKAGTPDHFHCTCGDGSFDGVGTHVCDETTGWSAWTNPRKLPTSGNWYLDTDITLMNSYSITATSTVNLCLNGHTINGSDSARLYYNAGQLTITDCKPADQQGQMIANSNQYGGVLYNSDKGATINIFGGTYKHNLEELSRSGGVIFVGEKDDNGESIFNLYGGTIIGASYNTYPGSAIAATRKAVFNMYGGTITGGKTVGNGGNLYMASGTANLYGGEITGGQAKLGGNINMNYGVLNLMGTKVSGGYATTDGGNIYINNTAVLNMIDGIVTGGYCANEGGNVWISDKGSTMNMEGGQITNGGADGEGVAQAKKGGNIQNFGVLTITGGEISGGVAKNAGGNIGTYTNTAQVIISGGTISGGVATKGANISIENNVSKNLVPFTVTGGEISGGVVTLIHGAANITGGTISGGLDVQGASTLEMSGTPVIAGSADFNLKISKGENVTLGDFETGAQIAVVSTELNVPFGTLVDVTDKEFFSSDDADTTLEINAENQLYLRSKHTHCVCGAAAADGKGDHTCDETVGWVKWTKDNALPNTAGYYYLSTDVTLTSPSWQTGLTDVYICLNGHTVLGPTDNRMIFQRGNLTITDCKPVDQQGSMISRFDAAGSVFYLDDMTGSTGNETPIDSVLTIYGGTYETDLDSLKTSGSVAFLGNKDLGGKTTLNMYGGVFNGAPTTASGGAIYAFRLATINLYGGTINGGKSPANGGAIYMATGEMNVYGGTISGGEAALGGSIHVANGTMNVHGGTITGGYATTDGGNIYLVKGTLNVTGGTITAGSCANEGGNVWVNYPATMTMSGGNITAGGVKDGTTVSRKGGNIQNFGILTISGGTVSGGKATVSGGNIGTYTNSCDITISGGTISNGTAPTGGNIHMTNDAAKNLTKLTISGGTISSGTITLGHGAATITGGTISGGVMVNGKSTLAISGNPVIAGATVNLSVSDGTKITVGDLTEGTQIGLTLKAGDLVGPLADPEDKVFFTCDDASATLDMNEENKLFVISLPHSHCLCAGAPMAAAASHTCTELTWTPISTALQAAGLTATTADFGKLASGNYYLDSNITVTGATALVGKDLNICLNGFTVTTSANATFAYGMKDGTLSITDCSYNAETKTWAGTMKGGTMTGSIKHGGILYTTGKQTVNIYGGNFTAKSAETAATNGGLFVVGQDNYDKTNAADKSVLNIYNGRFSDAKATNGGLITVFHTGDLNIYDGTFTKGNATLGGLINSSSLGTIAIHGGLFNNTLGAPLNSMGGAIYITKGTLDIKGGTFAGNAAYYGGAICAKNTTAGVNLVVNIANAKFFTSPSSTTSTANRAYHAGGNIFIESTAGTATLNIKAGTDLGYGYTTNTTFANAIVAAGGNVWAKNATVNMTGGTVIGGASINGGNFYFDGSTDAVYSLNISGGTVSGGRATHTGYNTNSCKYVDGDGKTVTVYPMGGNIHISGNEKLEISGSAEINDGVASHAGGNIAINYDADMQMSGGKAQGGTAAYAGNIFTNNSANVQLTISGGEITGGTLDKSKNTAGNGACFRLHTNVKLTLSGTPKIDEIFFCGASTKIDATGLNALETPIAIAGSNKGIFANVTSDLSGSFSYAGGTITYQPGEGDANGTLTVVAG